MHSYQGLILDSHVHLFDPMRSQGVPWPPADAPIHCTTLASHLFAAAADQGIGWAIAVEASPWADDNRWLCEAVRAHPQMLGFVGNLPLGETGCAALLDEYLAEPLFLGTRYGNLWDRDLLQQLDNPRFIADLQRLAASARTLDSANPDCALIEALLVLTDRVPELALIINHLPSAEYAPAEAERFWRALGELAARPQVSMKLSAIAQPAAAGASFVIADYCERLDRLWQLFGGERMLFGSDWPNSVRLGTYPQVLGLARAYLADKPVAVQRQVLLSNALRIYPIAAERQPAPSLTGAPEWQPASFV